MTEEPTPDLKCGKCDEPVTDSDRFCRNCGSVFSEGMFCVNHPGVEAKGVCVICNKPFCKNCGGFERRVFLCDLHYEYEIHEGMARIFGSTDNVQVHFIADCLSQAGFHPFVYSRVFNPGADTVVFTGPRNYGKYPIAEVKVLVPFSEVVEAERVVNQVGNE